MVSDRNYLTGLDGLRSIAIFILVIGHCAQVDFISIGGEALKSIPMPEGCLTVLFVLSGLLAGYFHDNNISDILLYYKKRAGRVLPVYYLYLMAVLFLYWMFGHALEVFNSTLWYYVFPMGFVPFCMSNGIMPLVHLWFVAVVVLFYLIFPWLCKMSGNKIKQVSLSFALILCVLKLLLNLTAGKDTFAYRFLGASQLDCMFFGVFLGILIRENIDLLHRIGDQRWLSLMAWAFFLLSGLYAHLVPAPIRNEFFALITTVMILGLISNKPLIKLEHGVWHFLGKISYSVYVLHVIILIGTSYVCNHFGIIKDVSVLSSLAIYSFCLGISIIVAWLCNTFFEKPMYKLISTK